MKNKIHLSLLGLALISLCLISSLAFSSKVKEEAKHEVKISLEVTGMVCGGCEANIKKNLLGNKGILEVSAKHKENRVFVKYNSKKVTADAIVKIITDLGYKTKLLN